MRALLAGGGTAGHVNPLLSVATAIRATHPDAELLVLGTAEGLEARLVPAAGFELAMISRVPFPRRINAAALRFPARLRAATVQAERLIRERDIEVVVGFGGYVSTPAYLAAKRVGVPIVIHEANAKPGLANRLAARWTRHVGVAFAGTPLPHAEVVGVPLRADIERLARDPAARAEAKRSALAHFGLDPQRPVLLVTGGSLGARRLNQTVAASAAAITALGWSVLHLTGANSQLEPLELAHYLRLEYCDRMDLALAASAAAISRAGAATVCELSALGIPAVFVPYPVGNGEQRFNAASVVAAGGALLLPDAEFTPEWVRSSMLGLLADSDRLASMAAASARIGVVDGTARVLAMIAKALA